MKKIAFYLPQFHEIEENNEWWGEGFTEWTNVKKSKPLFLGHDQPRIPMNNNYYDLSNIHVMDDQAKLARSYGLDAFCFYHYYFKDGKTLLEKPLENFLSSDIDIDYCFCWANESWTRNWDGKNKKVLMMQDYGNQNDWSKHFDYMLKYFCDDRYIKLENKPVFLIYKIEDIPNFNDFCQYWNKLAVLNGFDGIEFIAVKRQKNISFSELNLRYSVAFEPFYSLSSTDSLSKYYKLSGGVFKSLAVKSYDFFTNISYKLGFRDSFAIDYQKIVVKSINNQKNESDSLIPGCFVDWDNSPRRGVKAIIFKGFTIDIFSDYVKSIFKIAKNENKPFVFINAWNEWAEGTYLEPDVKHGHRVLEAVHRASIECEGK
ncbi:glycoside hydrolase family 99-like domain-containing protein [Shewanella xiamenensis]|uniref:glycosyltransferase WbsX family protein n=1 Tax=Shewanella xiamenensis TaxID=332186 RepID=UPI00313D2B73